MWHLGALWAHYAAHNHGIMLEFDPDAPMFQGSGFFRVEYDENRLICEAQPGEEIKQVAALARRKSRLWENEAEHRLVVPLDQTAKIVTDSGKPIYLLKVNPEWIRSITVGQRASCEIKSEINKLIRRPDLSHLQAQRYRMFMEPKIFRLNSERITNF